MKHFAFVLRGLASAMILGVSLAHAQYGVTDVSDLPAIGMTVSVTDPVTGEIVQIRFEPGRVIRVNGVEVTLQEDTMIPPNARISVDGKDAKIVERPGTLSLGIYPGTGWFLGGAIPVDNFGTVEGGTKFVWGSVLSASYRLPTKAPWTLNGWYYLPMNNDSKDLYQIGIQYMFSDSLGIQLGYLDSTEAEVDSATLQLIYKLRSGSCNSGSSPWEISFLSGIYYNWADFVGPSDQQGQEGGTQGFRRSRTSTGFSLALQGGVQLTKTYNLLGSYWFVNDRNLNVTRLGLGVGIKF